MPKKQIVETKEEFVNPFIFLPLEKKCDKTHEILKLQDALDLLTGWIECTLKTKSAIFIPNTTNDKTFLFPSHGINKEEDFEDFKSYDFYSPKILDEKTYDPPPPIPVIPSSELRALIRLSFEPLTNSCLSTVDTDLPLHKRLPSADDPAYLCKEGKEWLMKRCKKVRINKNRIRRIFGRNSYQFEIDGQSYQEADKIYVSVNKNDKVVKISQNSTKECNIEGYIHFSNDFDTKRHESIFIITDNRGINPGEKAVKNYKENLKIYRENDTYKWINPESKKFLVYFSEKNGNYYFKPGAIGRYVFINKISDLLDMNNAGYDPCKHTEALCPACLLFGFTSDYEDKRKNALGSRVRFTDGLLMEGQRSEDIFFNPGILKELSSPKIQATEFYLQRPKYEDKNNKVDFWNYDYAGNWNRQELIWEGRNEYVPQLCGRKLYWHQKILTQEDLPYIGTETEYKRKVGIRPLKPEVTFSFKIYFNNITEAELKKLIWVIEQGNKDNSQAHKIGMGKSLGLGSVKLAVEKVMVRQIHYKDKNLTYSIKEKKNSFLEDIRNNANPETLLGCNNTTLKHYQSIMEFEHNLSNIEYPSTLHSEENYDWFMDNRFIYPGSAFKWIIHQELCGKIENPILYKYDKQFKDRSRGKGKGKGKGKGYDRKSRDQADYGTKKTGTVNVFFENRGYGFINVDDEEDDIWFHQSNITGSGYQSFYKFYLV